MPQQAVPVKRMVNGQEHLVFNEGSATAFAFIPGGLKQIFDNESRKYVLVALDHKTLGDLQKHCDSQNDMILSQQKEIKNLQDEQRPIHFPLLH